MLEVKVLVECPALERLAAALAGVRTAAPSPAPTAPVTPAAPVCSAPAGQPTPAAPPAPAVPAAPTAAPTAAPSYTVEQLQKAGGDLITAQPDKLPALMGLLEQFGVPAVTALPHDRLGAFATALRGLGASL